MSLISLSVKHGRTLEEARSQLEMAVTQIRTQFGPMIHRVDWTTDRNGVKMFGIGFEIELRVDAQQVHVTGDIPLLSKLLAGPLVAGVKEIVNRTFVKQLPAGSPETKAP